MARRRERLKGRDLGPQGPLVLALETGGDHLGVALWRLPEQAGGEGGARLLEDVTQHRGHRHADAVLSLVGVMLERHELAPKDIELVAVGRGPGGFTGVRVGMATALGIGQGLGAAIWPVDSLRALAMNGAAPGAEVLAMIDARKGEVYGALYGFGGEGEIACLMEPMVAQASTVLERARERSDQPVILGSGALAYGVGSAVPLSWHVASAAHVGSVAIRAWEAADRDGSCAPSFDPAYVRASDAEIALERRLQAE